MTSYPERTVSQHVAENDLKALLACLEMLLAVDRMRSGQQAEAPRSNRPPDETASAG